MIEGKQKIPKLIIALGITFVICFALWVKAYSAGAVATPPAVLVFGPEKSIHGEDIPLRVVAMNALKRQRLAVTHFEIIPSHNSAQATIDGDMGRIDAVTLPSNEQQTVRIYFKDTELPLDMPVNFEGHTSRAFDGFSWARLQTDYATQLSETQMSFYPLWGSVSSSLENPGFLFSGHGYQQTTIATNPASVFDPNGYKLVLDRTGYGVTGPVSVVPGEEVTYEIRSNDPTRYFIHAWLDEDLTDMKRVTVSEKRETVSFIVPAKSKEDGTFWVSATQSPWLGVQGKAFASRISETSVSNMKAHFSWLEKQAGPVLNGDPFYQWLRAQENLPNQEQVLKAIQSRLVAPHFQAPLINALPKKQMADFETRKVAQLSVWRLPFRLSAFFLCFLALFWVRQEVAKHMSWKSEIVCFDNDSDAREARVTGWQEKVPWHNIWGFLAFLMICGLFWGADWVLGLTLNDYQF